MPCLEITTPELSSEIKEALALKLTDSFARATRFPAEIFGIHFNEYRPGNAASGSKICDLDKGRPYIHFLLYSPRLLRTEKQKLVSSLTTAYTEVLGKPEWKPVIHLCEHPYDNVGVNGQLLSDAYEELAESAYYYNLPKD
ncbi:MAG: tautomerase family protein [candidate division Zixibacteria bacterium]